MLQANNKTMPRATSCPRRGGLSSRGGTRGGTGHKEGQGRRKELSIPLFKTRMNPTFMSRKTKEGKREGGREELIQSSGRNVPLKAGQIISICLNHTRNKSRRQTILCLLYRNQSEKISYEQGAVTLPGMSCRGRKASGWTHTHRHTPSGQNT